MTDEKNKISAIAQRKMNYVRVKITEAELSEVKQRLAKRNVTFTASIDKTQSE